MLTATPYNKDFTDLANQLKLFLKDDADLGIQPEQYLRIIGGEREFSKRHEDYIRSIKAFERSSDADDWRELMRLFLIRRTRTFIKESYAQTDPINKRKYLQFRDGTKSYFPDRLPKSISFPMQRNDQFGCLYSEEVIDKMALLKLPRYGLTKYISDNLPDNLPSTDNEIINNLSRAGQRMMGFCRTNFFKRLDSSGVSYLISLYRHVLRNAIYIYAIENKLPLPIGNESYFTDDFLEDEDIENEIFEDNIISLVKKPDDTKFIFSSSIEDYLSVAKQLYDSISCNSNNVKWIKSAYFKRTLKQALLNDSKLLLEILGSCGKWDTDKDEKLNTLHKIVSQKHKDEKLIVFTQYSDTAKYIYSQLKKRGVDSLECVTGDSSNPTQIVERFSPISNYVEQTPNNKEQLRILVSTDVLSEGQNLQDAHIVINYDLPWAIIRLIQRAGRVDRIGQTAESVLCYSFFPAEGVERIIRLRQRLTNRINENAEVVGSDEIFFEGNEQNLMDIYNEKNGVLDDEDDGEVDLSSKAYQIWKNATEANPELKAIIPSLNNVVYSSKQNPDSQINEGVITYAKTSSDNDMLVWVNRTGEVITYSQNSILKTLACPINEPALIRFDNHHELVSKSIEHINTQEVKIGGTLGSRLSTKYRIYTMLEAYCKSQAGSLYVTDELKLAMDDIYNYPLQENARIILNRQLKKRDSDIEIAQSVVEMRNDDELSIKNDEEDTKNKEPQIICSMGLKNN